MKVIHFRSYVYEQGIRDYEAWLEGKQYTKVHFVNMVVEKSDLHIVVTYE